MIDTNEKILNSVIEITRQRDRDSLEFSLVATLAELIPLSKVSFFRVMSEISDQTLEEVVHLDLEKNDRGDLEFLWREDSNVIFADEAHQACGVEKDIIIVESRRTTRMIVPLLKGELVIGLLDIYCTEVPEEYRKLIHGLVRIYENYFYILSESEHDTLTGLLNRRTFDSRLSKLLEAQSINNALDKDEVDNNKRRLHTPDESAWLVVMDIDHFKRINDDFGHMYGDEVLLLLSQLMMRSFRHKDLLFRFGGEEFVVILAPTHENEVDLVVNRFRQSVQAYTFPQVGEVTISIGYASILPNDFPPMILDRADKALYYAKENGRNRACGYEKLVREGALTETKVTDDIELF